MPAAGAVSVSRLRSLLRFSSNLWYAASDCSARARARDAGSSNAGNSSNAFRRRTMPAWHCVKLVSGASVLTVAVVAVISLMAHSCCDISLDSRCDGALTQVKAW